MENPVVTIEMENGGIIKAELYPDGSRTQVLGIIWTEMDIPGQAGSNWKTNGIT